MDAVDGTTLEKQRWDALVTHDVEALERLFADDLTYTHSNGMVDTKASYLGALRDGVFRYTAADLHDLSARSYGDTAVVTGHATVTTESAAGELLTNLRYTAVWAAVDGSWQFVSWHSCGLAS
jgi:ketosteroid isomerase-like protein